MKLSRIAAALAVATVALAEAAVAQEAATSGVTPANPPPVEAAVPACCVIAAGTVIELEVTDLVTTKTNVRGDKFGLRLVKPIVVDGVTLVPADTTGVGEIVHAAKAGMAGKAAELIVAGRYLTYDGVRIPLRGFTIATHSKSQSDEATAAVIAVGVVGLLIKADETRIIPGARAEAKVATAVTIAPRNNTAAPQADATPSSPVARTDAQ